VTESASATKTGNVKRDRDHASGTGSAKEMTLSSAVALRHYANSRSRYVIDDRDGYLSHVREH